MEKRPNIILITTDQQRSDSLGINGNSMVRSPNLDALAREGVHFANAFVQNTVCVPSRACLQTGRYTHQHGVTYMESVVDDTPGLPEHEKTFMEMLQENGYYTGATGKIHMYPAKGFDWQQLCGGKGHRWLQAQGSSLGPGPLGEVYAAWLEKKRPGAYEQIYAARRATEHYLDTGVMDIPLSNDEYVESWIAEESEGFIRRQAQQEQPFFLWCGFCGPHGPMDPPEPYRSMYAPENVPLPLEVDGCPSWREKWSEPLMRKAIAYYYGMVTCIDDHVGQLVRTLKELDIYQDTLILFVSDHGEMLGDRGRLGKGVFYDSVMRVPMLIKPPARIRHLPRTFTGQVEAMSVAPTILQCAGIAVPENVSATSLLPQITGASSDGAEMVFSEFVSNDKSEVSKCVRTDDYKYILFFNDGRQEFYNLQNDPLEKDNLALAGREREKMLSLRDALFFWLARTEWCRSY
ncbi:MAG: sulfatase-like hydrolase/transferase [Oligosphaeraceae bacterium]|nr:sulfatase-like hydrolase/transferase [Oligosphaeraceae bacterium]